MNPESGVYEQPSYSLIFVDDENIIREGISSRVNWGKNGFSLKGVFEDGTGALEFMENNQVDVLLSDISMPRMDGLTLSRIVAEKYPRTLVLLLTGFEDFEYARQAIRNQVKEFLLKPVTAEELEQVLRRTWYELNHRRNNEEEQNRLKNQLKDSIPLAREQILHSIISGRLTRATRELALKELGNQWRESSNVYRAGLISIPPDMQDSGGRHLFEALLQQLQKACAANSRDLGEGRFSCEAFAGMDGSIVILFREEMPGQPKEILRKITAVLQAACLPTAESAAPGSAGRASDLPQNAMPLPVIAGIGNCVTNLESVRNSYLEAEQVVDHLGFLAPLTSPPIIAGSMENLREKPAFPGEVFNTLSRELVKGLEEDGPDQAIRILNNILAKMEESSVSSREAAGYLSRLNFMLSDFMDRTKLRRDGEEPWRDIRAVSRLAEAREVLASRIFYIEKQMSLRRQDTLHARVDKACRIIEERYSCKNFSLAELCRELCLGTSQCSALFKEGTGRTFVEYLTDVRIDKAKKLLKSTDLRSYEIAERVGYRDPRYFSSIFHKCTGMTTTQYRRKLDVK